MGRTILQLLIGIIGTGVQYPEALWGGITFVLWCVFSTSRLFLKIFHVLYQAINKNNNNNKNNKNNNKLMLQNKEKQHNGPGSPCP